MPSRAFRRLAVWSLTLFVVWLSLPERFTPLHIAVGVIGSILIALTNLNLKSERDTRVSWWRALAYFPWLFWKILLSGFHISYVILHPKLPIQPQLLKYPTRYGTDSHALLLLGNSITLTPGTITVDAFEGEIEVHALDKASLEAVTSHSLRDRVDAVFPLKEVGR